MEHTPFLMNLSILMVDDEEVERNLFKCFVKEHGGRCHTAGRFSEAQKLVERNQFDVLVCDIYLNGDGSGLDLVDQVREIDQDLTVILITGKDINQIIKSILVKEIYALLQKPYDINTLCLLLLHASRATRDKRSNRYYAEKLRNKITAIQHDKNKIFLNTLLSLSNALEQKDEYTKDHSEVVAQIAEKITWEYSDNKEFIEDVIISGKLHDIGKIGIQDIILFKRSSLNEGEFDLIKKHPEMSYKIVKPVDTTGKISSYVLHHHERWDGTGYPHNLVEKNIPTGARILSVADTFNALTSDRPYRRAMTHDKALEIVFESAGRQLDPEMVEIVYQLIRSGRISQI